MTSRRTFEETYPVKDSYKRFDQRDSAFGRRLKETGRIVGFGTEEDRARRIKMNLPGFSLVDYAFNSAADMYETLPGERDSQGTGFYSWGSLGVAKKTGGIPRWEGPLVRICKIFIDLPLPTSPQAPRGIIEFCEACKKCAKHCPS